MILIFDYFETIMHNRSMDFNRALADLWKTYYKDKCCFNDITAYGEELFLHLQKLHKQGFEFAFVKDELPMYAQKFGGDVIQMSPSEEADFLMKCNEMEVMPCITEAKVWSSADYGKIESDVKGAITAGIDVIWLNHKNENNCDNLPAHCIYHTCELEAMVKSLYSPNK